ncbi:MAG: Alpha/beta hydrolase family protein [Smithella sp. PtaU1.Bin162]|nr:MAG: Alpha/beta hydrolase family protein [Smithella sp. PtaU1.Bin162]
MAETSQSLFPQHALSAALTRQTFDYWVDFWQRTILFWDVLRQRSNQYYQHKKMPVPHVLNFEAKLVFDGRTFERPVNYGLAWIKPPNGVVIDPKKRPFVVVDPRAGHGPGIGGFKTDSEIGVAMNAGHPCYFIGFTPDPMPGQTIEDIIRAEAVFLEKVVELHPNAEGKPCVIGNCQAGWAVMMLAATRPELFGPIIVAGAPLSYWAGMEGQNPMRYNGGMLGGSWLTALAGDLGNGKFDGAYLAGNFENLNPANTFWIKNYNLWARVDSEAKRFLEFETWWGGHVNLTAEEMQWIVDQLFIGNRLATAEIITDDRIRIDLRNIRSPIVCFCSKGDNITPPQQALGWIVDLYEKDDDLRACGQTIVYAIHESIGHLGIFVSGGIARKEHEEFASNIDLIDVLPPGLYEAIIIPKTADTVHPDLVHGEWITRFEPRTLDDIRAIVQPQIKNERRFAAVRRVSEINLGLYRTLLQPFVQTVANEQTAIWLHKLNPAELPYELFSDSNPFMRQITQFAKHVREHRRIVSPDNPLSQLQTVISNGVIANLNMWRALRDQSLEQIFLKTYDAELLQALVGLWASDKSPRWRPGVEPERIEFIRARIAELKTRLAKGGLPEAAIRSLIYVDMAEAGVDERNFEALRRIRAKHVDVALEEFKCLIREQFFTLLLDRDAALAAIPAMLPADADTRTKTLAEIREIVSAAGEPVGERATRLAQMEKLFGILAKLKVDPGKA